ncbi:hypothetical protein MUY27_03420 [Mucilaginibacter sp. RS28]|uniref:Uncharacterized protein n=1 Tax=Mucilaginibacter straminoryzae TaxID=2932774 RepID=A0A9X2BAF9_9SPHI|nr:hypothetical protein [Mucilaginibacter straminoryzae]MCJ8208742.1 hypothetical protein [Mucilaginibacter straminoryzae]
MTILRVAVDDEQAEALIKMLEEVPYVKKIEEEHEQTSQVKEPETAYQRIKKLLDEAKGKDLFKEIEDPVEWQRQLRREWDRDF